MRGLEWQLRVVLVTLPLVQHALRRGSPRWVKGIIGCGQPTRDLTHCIEERVSISRFIGLSFGCNNEVRAGRFISFVSAEHPLGLVEGHHPLRQA